MTRLTICVTEECWSCDESRRIATEVQESFPDVEVVLVDLDSEQVPTEVFAAPTYLLDGQVIFLGNPRREDLWQRLSRRQQHRMREAREG